MTSKSITGRTNSISSSRQSKLTASVLPKEVNDDKVPVSRQWLLALRRFIKLAITRSDYTVREIETRLYPTIRHAEGCPAVENDEVHCLQDTFRVDHAAECPSKDEPAKFCTCPRALVSAGCPDRELRMTLRCILESLIDLTEQAPIRKFGSDEEYLFPTRDGYTAMVVEIEFLRERLAELGPDGADRLGAPEIIKMPADTEPRLEENATQ
jgi:hypothetical protein